MAVTSELIEQVATTLQDIRPEPARVPELGREVDRLNCADLGDAGSDSGDGAANVKVRLLAKEA